MEVVLLVLAVQFDRIVVTSTTTILLFIFNQNTCSASELQNCLEAQFLLVPVSQVLLISPIG